jgi:large subunit ribosomal protein L4
MSNDQVSGKGISATGASAGDVALSADIFAVPVRQEMIHQAVRWQRAKARAGTHSTLTRSEMKGGKKKPWKQKGTGRARAGSSVSPLWVGGAVVHGPQPRDYEFRFPRASRLSALKSALSDKARSGDLIVADSFPATSGKTKSAVRFLEASGRFGQKVLLVTTLTESGAEEISRSMRNLQGVSVVDVAGLNVYDIVNAQCVMVSKQSLAVIEKRLTA